MRCGIGVYDFRYQIARYNEKYIDTDESAREYSQPKMKNYNTEYRDATQAFYVRAILHSGINRIGRRRYGKRQGVNVV